MQVYINGNKANLDKKNVLGIGGEAEVILYKGRAVKIYHSNALTNQKIEKLKAFPQNLPKNVLAPEELVTDKDGNVIGYVMDAVMGGEVFAMLSNIRFRKQFSWNSVLKIFVDAYKTLMSLHSLGVIVGDYNDLNILFLNERSIYIDADSMQFGSYPCVVATEQFLDPNLYGIDLSNSMVFTKESDYYSYAVMLFRSLLFVSPYGGVHKQYPTFLKRAKSRISVFNKDVVYPKAALPLNVIPDDLLQEFFQIFDKGKRGSFPINLIENLEWKQCSDCGTMHLRSQCPCKMFKKEPVLIETIVVNRTCTASTIFKTKGKILFVKQEQQNGKLKFIYEENELLKRENGSIIIKGSINKDIKLDIMGENTIVSMNGDIAIIKDGVIIEKSKSEVYNNRTVVSSTTNNFFRVVEGVLMNRDLMVANVLENQTFIKAGVDFGFGFYRIGLKTNYFIFPVNGKGIKDIKLPDISGKLIEVDCLFSSTHLLLLLSTMENGKEFNTMMLISKEGNLIAMNKENALDSDILSTIRGKAILNSLVLTTTDEGLLLLDKNNSTLSGVKLFKDTEPFVNTECQIFPASDGVYVVSMQDIKLLKLN